MEIVIYILSVIGFIGLFVLMGLLLLTDDDWKKIREEVCEKRGGN